jgi:hypothetical protein
VSRPRDSLTRSPYLGEDLVSGLGPGEGVGACRVPERYDDGPNRAGMDWSGHSWMNSIDTRNGPIVVAGDVIRA